MFFKLLHGMFALFDKNMAWGVGRGYHWETLWWWMCDEVIIPSKLSPKPVSPWCSPDDSPWGRCRRVSSCRCKWPESRDSRSMLRDTLDAKLVTEVTIPTTTQIQTRFAALHTKIPHNWEAGMAQRLECWSFCQKCRWQVTAKHAPYIIMWLGMKWQ